MRLCFPRASKFLDSTKLLLAPVRRHQASASAASQKRKSGIEETSGGGEAGNPGNLEKAAGISPRWHSETWKWPKPFAVMASSRLQHESRFLKSNFQRQIQRQKQILFVLKRQRIWKKRPQWHSGTWKWSKSFVSRILGAISMIYGVHWSYVVYVLAVKSSCSYLQEFCVFDLSPSCSPVYVWRSKLQKCKNAKMWNTKI